MKKIFLFFIFLALIAWWKLGRWIALAVFIIGALISIIMNLGKKNVD
jgi:hypothetical protein